MSLAEENIGGQMSLKEKERAKHLKKSAVNLQETLVRTCSPFVLNLLSEVYSELAKLGVDFNSVLLTQAL